MKILHIVKATRLSGAERHLLILLPALRQRGVDACLLLLVEANKPMDNIVAECEQAGVPVQRLRIRRGLDLTIVGRIQAIVKAEKPDIVHTHLIHADLFGLLAARLAGVTRVITTRHNDDSFRYRLPIRVLNGLNWRGVESGIAISRAIKKFVTNVEGAPTNKVTLVHYGLKHQRLDPHDIEQSRAGLRTELNVPSDTLLIGIVSRLTEQKGVSYAIEAMKSVVAEFPKAHLVIAGEGELKDALKARAKTLSLDKNIHFLGWRADASQVLQALDVFLMPSLWEGFGLTLLEAMSARLPVVASHVSAIPEIVEHGETGYLVAPKDSEAIVYALRLLLPDKLLRQYMGFNGEDRLESHFSVEKMADKTLDVYHQRK